MKALSLSRYCRLTPLIPAGMLAISSPASAELAHLPNAWQITDASSSFGSTLGYSATLSAAHQAAVNEHGFRLTFNARFLSDYGGRPTMTMSYGLGSGRLLVWFDLDSKGDLTATLEGGPTFTLTTNGTGGMLYHKHEILFDPISATASYWFDGVSQTNCWPVSSQPSPAGRVSWGASSSDGCGQMNFNRVMLEITNALVMSYDAGTAGSASVVLDPIAQGWTVTTTNPFPGTIAAPVAADLTGTLPNAWQVSDGSSGAGSMCRYTSLLDDAQRVAVSQNGFRFAINARFVSRLSDTGRSLGMGYGLGNRRLLIWFDLNANGDLTAELEGGTTYTLTSNGTGSARYHTHEIRFHPTSGTASYLVDGDVLTNRWSPSPSALPDGEISWGAGSSHGQGRMNFHSVTFEIANGVAAGYDAGMLGRPRLAPDPLTQGWSRSQTHPRVDLAAISPDLALLPSALTLRARQPRAGIAHLNGQVIPRGSPAVAWFEWGSTRAYGFATVPRPVGAGMTPVSVEDVITNLAGGTAYDFRMVVSNRFGIARGDNQSFTYPGFAATGISSAMGVHQRVETESPSQGGGPGFLLLSGMVLLGMTGVFLGMREWRACRDRRVRAAQEGYSRALLASQEAERKRVAAELHDSLGQSLQIIKGRAQWGLNQLNAPGEGKKQLQEICEAATQAIGEVRAISHALRPAELDQLGLTRAVEWMAEQASTASQTRFACEIDNLDRVFPPELEISLYRIAQEGISNVLKHARASEAILEIKRSEGLVQLSLFDNGCGFVKSAPMSLSRARFGQGLAGIEERARLMGGHFELQSAPGRGTRLTVRCRLHDFQ